MNLQFAVQGDKIFILEVNPRASRTVPFVSKAIGWSVAKVAVACMLGKSLAQQNIFDAKPSEYYAVKQSVFPFIKFPGVDPLLGPEMRSTGEVMAFGKTFAQAYKKSLQAVGIIDLKSKCRVYIEVCDSDQYAANILTAELYALGHQVIVCTSEEVLALIANNDIDLIISTIFDKLEISAAHKIRAAAIRHKINCCTTLAGARAMLATINCNADRVYKLQKIHDEQSQVYLMHDELDYKAEISAL